MATRRKYQVAVRPKINYSLFHANDAIIYIIKADNMTLNGLQMEIPNIFHIEIVRVCFSFDYQCSYLRDCFYIISIILSLFDEKSMNHEKR